MTIKHLQNPNPIGFLETKASKTRKEKTTDLTMAENTDKEQLSSYRRNLLLLILVSAGIDVAIFSFELPLVLTFMGAPLIVDELVEFVISYLLGKNKLKLKKRYKIAGFIPIPGITSLALQGVMEYIKSIRSPEKVLLQLAEPK